MDNLRCTEYLSDSPSTSNTLNVNTAVTISQSRRRSVKITNDQRFRHEQGRLVLGQLPVNRKRAAPADRLNAAQWPSVLALSDKAIHQDNRCVENMFTAQNFTAVSGNYFLSIQTHITAKHRQQAVEWLLDVCKEEQCEPDVFPLAVSFVDRFLGVQNIFRDSLQALASVCLFIASKVKAPQPLNATRIAYYTDGGVCLQEILNWEILVLSKLNWDVSTSTALDFLDQVAARYSPLHGLGDACRNAVHRIQLEEKFAFLVPSMQAAISLLFSAVRTGSDDVIGYAEHALFHVLRCDPKILYGYLGAVERVVDGYGGDIAGGDITPLMLTAPPSSGDYLSPAVSPYRSTAYLQNVSSAYTTPDHHSRASDDSGFNSGFSSPAAFLDVKTQGASQVLRRHHMRRGASRAAAANHRTFENFDNGMIVSFHPTEDEFLRNF
uniref:Cyclin N-terminal domain-containing protein n=1 Tax=Parascaris univalens TaxID=6257 RepID=A0A915C9I7_PARUN